MKTQKEINLGYRIIKIQTNKFEFQEIDVDNLDAIFEDNESLRIDSGVQINIDKNKETIVFDIQSSLIYNFNETNIITHIGKTVFKIRGLEDVYDEETDSFDFPDEFMVQLYSLSYSHARALLSTELAVTIYRDKFFLPIIDPYDIINKKKLQELH